MKYRGLSINTNNVPRLVKFYSEVLRAEAEGDWGRAARLFEYTGKHYRNELWMKARAARAYFHAGNPAGADRLSREINQVRPTVATLLLEAKVCREQRDYVRAIRLLSQAEDWLSGPVE